MSGSNVRFEGYLDLLSGGSQGVKRKALPKFCVLHSGSTSARLDLYETKGKFNKGSKGSTLLYCEQIQEISPCQTDGKHSLMIKTAQADSPFTFVCKTPAELETWLSAFHDVMKGRTEPDYEVSNRAWRRDSASSGSSGQSYASDKTAPRAPTDKGPRYAEETPYQALSISSIGLYRVGILETVASQRCNLTGPHKLEITNKNLTLWSPDVSLPVFIWPYQHIRKFGYGDSFFKLEAGRRADSGEGTFGFETSQGQEIIGLAQKAAENSMRA